MIRWLVVDLGGVAAHYRPELRARTLAAATGLDPTAVDDRLFASGLDGRAERGDIPPANILDTIRAALDADITDDHLVAEWSAAFEPNPDVLDAIGAASVLSCLFTNNGPIINLCLAGPLASVSRSFDRVVCSWELGATKPSAVAFERAQSILGASADEILLLDDSEANVQAAIRSGWHAKHVIDVVGVRTALDTHGL